MGMTTMMTMTAGSVSHAHRSGGGGGGGGGSRAAARPLRLVTSSSSSSFSATLVASSSSSSSSSSSRCLLLGLLLLVSLILLPSPGASALPGAPTRLFASEVTASSVKLSWDSGPASSRREPVLSYVILYKPLRKKGGGGGGGGGGKYRERGNVVQSVHTVAHLKAFTQYEFRVVAVSSVGRGAPSAPIQLTTGELGWYQKAAPSHHHHTT